VLYSAGVPPSLNKKGVDLLDVDAAVLHRLRRVGDLQQLAGGCANISGAAVDLKAFRRDGDFLT
jgi:hypothetical protein